MKGRLGSFGIEIPVGLGLDVKMGKNAYFNVQLEYHLGLEDNRNNLQHGHWISISDR